jgi:hypothetical protein
VSHSVCHSEPVADHRAELAQALVRALGRGFEAGDLVATQIAHRALGELIAKSVPSECGAVLDLVSRQRKRGRTIPLRGIPQ